MGILASDVQLLFYAKTLGVSFTETLTLGRMQLFASKKDIQDNIDKYRNQEKRLDEVVFKDAYAEPVFEILGAKKVESMDYSDYEKATILHDLNKPLPRSLYQSFSAVIDGGTLEHVFNFPEAIRSSMLSVKTGGHYIGITPANNQMGHGFYQFSPDLYFRIFSEENGFRIKRMLLNVAPTPDQVNWFEVSDPKVVHSRVSLTSQVPLFLVVIAEKIADKPIFETPPQQSDYQAVWSDHAVEASGAAQPARARLVSTYRKWMPKRIKIVLRNTYDLFTKEKAVAPGLGEFSAAHFVPVEL
jgi:hypothetical protein